MLRHSLLLLCTFFIFSVNAQSIEEQDHRMQKRNYVIKRMYDVIKVDGVLDEQIWEQANVAKDFVEWSPRFGDVPDQRTEVRLLYTDQAIYVGAMMYDSSPDSILTEMGLRDATNMNADFFQVFFDTYDDDITSQTFRIYASGVVMDVKESNVLWDLNWDPVFDHAVRITDEGWIVEMEIPYSAIRFPNANEMRWGLNFDRVVRRTRERYSWAPINPEVDGFVNQFNSMTGLKDIEPPLRLSLTPYASFYYEEENQKPSGDQLTGTSARGGLDLKYGINESFTLDMTIIPDFGQVRSDDLVLNLGPFETSYSDNRPFFNEGTDIFDQSHLFYTRRIGGRPQGYFDVYGQLNTGDELVENPMESQLLNAAKISGRTEDGLGIGVFNAVTNRTFATIKDSNGIERKVETDPVTNYNVIVFDQSLPRNSRFTLMNTNVSRPGGLRQANVGYTKLELFNEKKTFKLYAAAAGSRVLTRETADSAWGNKIGHTYYVQLSKISGRHNAGIYRQEESTNYDPNDMGILFAPNEILHGAWYSYSRNEPFWKFNSAGASAFIDYAQRYSNKEHISTSIRGNWWTNSKSYFSWGGDYSFALDQRDYYEPRTTGRYYEGPDFGFFGMWVSTDYRKKFAFDLSSSYLGAFDADQHRYIANFKPRFRINDRITLIHSFFIAWYNENVGWVANSGDDIYFGGRRLVTYENLFTTSYIFSPKMALEARARHYLSGGNYIQFYELEQDGSLSEIPDQLADSFSFNTVNIDLVYRWEFLPGSKLSLAWKHSIAENSENFDVNLFRNIDMLSGLTNNNSFSLKVLYYLDYLQLKGGSRRLG